MTIRKVFTGTKPSLLKLLLFFAIIFAASDLQAQNIDPINGNGGCMVNGTIYWTRSGSTNFYQKTVFTDWNNSSRSGTNYSSKADYACSTITDTGSTCFAGISKGTLVTYNFVACPLDNSIVLLGMAILLYVIYQYRSRKQQGFLLIPLPVEPKC